MPELRAHSNEVKRRITILHTRAEPDDLYDPPSEPEVVEPCAADADDYDLDEIDIYGLNDFDEDFDEYDA